MESAHRLQMDPQGFDSSHRKHRYAVFVSLAVTHHDLLVAEIEVFDPQPQAIHQSQARTIEECCHEPKARIDGIKQLDDLLPGKNHWQFARSLGAVLPVIVTIGLVGTLIGIIGLILNRRCLLNWLAVAVNAGLLVVPAKEWWEFRTAASHEGYGCDPLRGRLINLCDHRCRSFLAQPACHVVRRIKMGRNELFELRGAVGFQGR
jgi:hypothetical protein